MKLPCFCFGVPILGRIVGLPVETWPPSHRAQSRCPGSACGLSPHGDSFSRSQNSQRPCVRGLASTSIRVPAKMEIFFLNRWIDRVRRGTVGLALTKMFRRPTMFLVPVSALVQKNPSRVLADLGEGFLFLRLHLNQATKLIGLRDVKDDLACASALPHRSRA